MQATLSVCAILCDIYSTGTYIFPWNKRIPRYNRFNWRMHWLFKSENGRLQLQTNQSSEVWLVLKGAKIWWWLETEMSARNTRRRTPYTVSLHFLLHPPGLLCLCLRWSRNVNFCFIPGWGTPAEEKREGKEMCSVASGIWILPCLPITIAECYLWLEDLERKVLGYCLPFNIMLFWALSALLCSFFINRLYF